MKPERLKKLLIKEGFPAGVIKIFRNVPRFARRPKPKEDIVRVLGAGRFPPEFLDMHPDLQDYYGIRRKPT